MSPLQVERAAAEHWAPILLGTRKLSDMPYTPGPVNGSVVSLAKLTTMVAHAKFSSGERHGAVTLLLDGLTMASRFRAATPPLAAQCESLILNTFAQSLDAIPLLECDRVRAALTPMLVDTTLTTKRRSRLSLLRLHMRVEAYRWKYLKVPGRLTDAAPAGEIADPATKRPFKFETTTSGYRLVSEEYDALGAG